MCVLYLWLHQILNTNVTDVSKFFLLVAHNNYAKIIFMVFLKQRIFAMILSFVNRFIQKSLELKENFYFYFILIIYNNILF